ncbi:MAG TPA: hypothetical protein VFN23_19325 [Ktedonobacteraceae bacterium]|nr:hypothetical protein [Ktedonobacteraceae bacterium]
MKNLSYCSGSGRFWALLLATLSLFLLAGCGTSTGLLASGGSWQISSLQHQHIHTLAVDPQNPQIIYAGDIQNGIYRSSDGGLHWNPLSTTTATPRAIEALAFDASNKNLFAATSSGLFESGDGAKSWSLLSTAQSGLPNDNYTALTFDYGSQNIAYLGTARHGVFSSHDDGRHWQVANGSGLPTAQPIRSLVYDPVLHQLWATTSTGFYRSSNNGGNWMVLTNGIPASLSFTTAVPAAASGGQENLVFGGTSHGIFYSQDDGAHWRKYQESLAGTTINQIMLDFRTPTTVYLATSEGAFRSTDSAQNWQGVGPGLPRGRAVYALSLGGSDNNQLFAAVEDVYLYPGTSGGLDFTRVLTLLLIVLGFILFYLFVARIRRRAVPPAVTPASSAEGSQE